MNAKKRICEKTASLLEEKSERMLINSISDYEIEIRIVESKRWLSAVSEAVYDGR